MREITGKVSVSGSVKGSVGVSGSRVEIDPTLTVRGAAADAETVGLRLDLMIDQDTYDAKMREIDDILSDHDDDIDALQAEVAGKQPKLTSAQLGKIDNAVNSVFVNQQITAAIASLDVVADEILEVP